MYYAGFIAASAAGRIISSLRATFGGSAATSSFIVGNESVFIGELTRLHPNQVLYRDPGTTSHYHTLFGLVAMPGTPAAGL